MFAKIKWILKGKPVRKYSGYNCGCCGDWYEEYHEEPAYDLKESQDFTKGKSTKNIPFSDIWGLCPNGCKMLEEEEYV